MASGFEARVPDRAGSRPRREGRGALHRARALIKMQCTEHRRTVACACGPLFRRRQMPARADKSSLPADPLSTAPCPLPPSICLQPISRTSPLSMPAARCRSGLLGLCLALLLALPCARVSALRAAPGTVVVYGATGGGFGAAIAAARGGARTVLISQSSHVGGMVTGGLQVRRRAGQGVS